MSELDEEPKDPLTDPDGEYLFIRKSTVRWVCGLFVQSLQSLAPLARAAVPLGTGAGLVEGYHQMAEPVQIECPVTPGEEDSDG